MPTPLQVLRLPLTAWTYALSVAAVATLGFTTTATPAILLAAVLTLPSSVIAVAVYYLAFGLLAQIPGANPSQSSGTGSCPPHASCQVSTAGDPASWFTHATELVGILALTAAALLNVVLLRRIAAARAKADPGTQPGGPR